MVAAATMSPMAKRLQGKSVPVQGRLTLEEVAKLDAAAAQQSVPVDRATLVSYILRRWLREQPGLGDQSKRRDSK